jgi:hypothetical protein
MLYIKCCKWKRDENNVECQVLSFLKHHAMGRLRGIQAKLLTFWTLTMNRDDWLDSVSERVYPLDKRHGGFQKRSQSSGDAVGDRNLLHLYHWLSCRRQCQYVRHLHHRSRIFLPWRWRRYVPPKRRLTQELHGATSQKTAFFIIKSCSRWQRVEPSAATYGTRPHAETTFSDTKMTL